MQTFLFLTILALAASPIYAEGEASSEKKVDKRGLLGLGYGGYGGYYGLNGYGAGYGQHGYLNAAAYPALGHGVPYSSLGHGVAPSYSHSYTAPISINHGYTAPVYTVPQVGYHGVGHGLNYLQGW